MSKPIETELVDQDVVYATGHDVFTHIRNKRYPDLPDDASSVASNSPGVLTKEQVADLIDRFSERADKTTRRAWRERRVSDYEVRVKFSHTQKRGRHRRRRRRSGAGHTPRIRTHAGNRGMANLPHNHVVNVETVEVLNPRSVEDITADQGRDTGSWIIDERKGVIRPDVTLFVPTGTGAANGRDIEDARIRVTYTYGASASTSDPNDLPDPLTVADGVPGDVRDAVALLTAARLVGSDQYGELTPQASGDSPSLAEAVSSWKSEAKETLAEYTRP